jgi:ligand-binding SRPBCC domain-containing protein
MHFLEREIVLNTDIETLWQFMATPANLNELTPPQLQFQIVSELPDKMYNGLMIQYLIKIPWFGRWQWLTEIKHIRAGEYFVDEQRLGPYRLWHHQHLLEPVGADKTRMIDRVSYRLPFGMVGTLLHELWVKKLLDEIFTYRAQRMLQIFA